MKIEKIKNEDVFKEESTIRISNYKQSLKKIKLYECEICHISKWLENEISLEIDHINGINNDNRLENLRFLCPNCHSQTINFRGRNIKKIRNKDGFFKYSKKEFIEVVKDSLTIREVCLKLKLTPKGGNYETIKKLIKKFKIDLKKIKIIELNKCKCGNEILKESKLCIECYQESQRKVERPNYETLKENVKENGFSATGRKYGVSDNSIRKWIKFYEKGQVV